MYPTMLRIKNSKIIVIRIKPSTLFLTHELDIKKSLINFKYYFLYQKSLTYANLHICRKTNPIFIEWIKINFTNIPFIV